MVLLLSNQALAAPMCPEIRERLSASNYVSDDLEMYFGYACENRQTTIVFNYADVYPIKVVQEKADEFTNFTCDKLRDDFDSSDKLGKEVMTLVHSGGYTFVYRHPLLEFPIVQTKSFQECIR